MAELNGDHIREIERYVEENQANKPVYTVKHVFPAAEIGKRMAYESENADPLIVAAGLLLHDIGYHKTYESEERDHIVRGVEVSRTFLDKLGIDASDRDRVLDTIRTHDGRLEPESPMENILVNDADQVAVFRELPWMYTLMTTAFGMSHERALMGCVQEAWGSYNRVISLDSTRKRFAGDYEVTKLWLRDQVSRIPREKLGDNPPRELVEESYRFLDELLA